MLSLHLLGSFSITRDGVPLTGFVSNKVQALLVYLAVTDKTHTRDALATLLWSGVPEKVAKHSLRQALSNLRKLVPEGVEITRQTASIVSAEITTDARRFKMLLADGNARAAAECYNGDFLTGFFIADAPDFEAWQVVQREQLHRMAFDLLNKLQNDAQQEANLTAALDYARQLLVLEPWHEPTHRRLMRLHAQRGDYAAGLAQFAACKKLLQTELSVEPELATRQLYERIAAARNRPIARRQQAQNELIGRQQELAKLNQLLLSQQRLVSLTGPGGFGKTRIARQLADNLRLMWLDGVYFIALAAVESPTSVPWAIAHSVGLESPGSTDILPQLQRWLAPREVLLVLDNCEQLVGDDLSTLLQGLLDAAPELSLLITSRERLAMSGEQVVMLEGLAAQREAVELFINAARRQLIDFVPDAAAMEHIKAICQLVSNVPLALELAASQGDLYDVADIETAIKSGISKLSTQLRQVPARQRSLQAVFDTSWERLTDEEQAIYAGLSVFVDGFTLAAATAVVQATPAVMRGLVNKSLLARVGNHWKQHPLLLQFSAEKLSADPARKQALLASHADYFAQFLNEGFAEIQLIKLPILATVTANLPNINQAWRFALSHQQISNIAISFRPLAFYYDASNRLVEWQEDFRLALKFLDTNPDLSPQQQNPLLAGILVAYATSLEVGGVYREAHEVAKRSLAIANAYQFDEARYHATIIIGRTYFYLGQLAQSAATLRSAIDIAIKLNDDHAHARILQSLGGSLIANGKVEEAKTVYQRALRLFDKVGDERGVMYAKVNLGQIANMQEQDALAWRYWNEILSNEELPKRHLLYGTTHNWIALFHLRKGQFAEAQIAANKSLSNLSELTFTSVYFDALVSAGMTAVALENFERARNVEQELMQLFPKLASPIHGQHFELFRAFLLLKTGELELAMRRIQEILVHPATGWTTKQMIEKGVALLAGTL